ncbi:MAG: hypothetical protein QM640_02750 [Niabella sp.]
MYTLIVIICFTGFFQVYNTSSKAKLSSSGVYEKWLQSNLLTAKITGTLLLITAFTLLIVKDGWPVGTFTFILLLMAAACYTIAIAPLQYLKLKHLLLIAAFSLLMELIVFI